MQVASTGLPYLIVPVQPAGLAGAAIQIRTSKRGCGCCAKFVYVLDPAAAEGRTWALRTSRGRGYG